MQGGSDGGNTLDGGKEEKEDREEERERRRGQKVGEGEEKSGGQ